MSKSWRVISLVVLIAILLGAVCVGVGLVTGGEWDRIYSTLDARYHIDMYVEYVGQVLTVIRDAWVSPGASDAPTDTPAPVDTPAPADSLDTVVIQQSGAEPAPAVTPAA